MFSNEAFAQNAEKYMDTVFRVAYGWLKNPDDANDVTQDVLIELYKTDKAFESDAHLKNWLIRVTVNRCKMLFRSPWRRHEDIDDYAETLSFEQPRDGELFKAVMAFDSSGGRMARSCFSTLSGSLLPSVRPRRPVMRMQCVSHT